MAGKIGVYQYFSGNENRNKLYRFAVGTVFVLTISTLICLLLINTLSNSTVFYQIPLYTSRVQRSADDKIPGGNMTESWCFSNKSIMPNGSWFQCPLPDQKSDMTSCCGPKGEQVCCVPKDNKDDDEMTQNEIDVITAVSIVAAFVVSMTCCMILYCCCGQKRPEIRSGKLILIKKKKFRKKDGSEEAQVETELIDYNDYVKQQNMTHAINGNNDSSQKTKSRENLQMDTNLSSPTKHVTSSGQEMTVPLINIQASTPTDPQ